MYSNWFFTFVFVVEMFMKILALGMSGYLDDKWNQLDMVIVILSVIGIILECLEMWTRQGKLQHLEHVTKGIFRCCDDSNKYFYYPCDASPSDCSSIETAENCKGCSSTA